MNKIAPEFFSIVQNALWENALLHIARLTDPQKSRGKPNLSILSMIELIDHPETKATAGDLANEALAAVLNAVESHYAGSTTYFEFKSDSALSLLYVLDDGLTADKERWERRKSGNFVTSELRQRDL